MLFIPIDTMIKKNQHNYDLECHFGNRERITKTIRVYEQRQDNENKADVIIIKVKMIWAIKIDVIP